MRQRFGLIAAAHLILVNDDNQILLGRRQNTGFADGCYHLPSGHLEPGETLVEALIRESREETGVRIDAEHVEFVHVMHDASSGGRAQFFFQVKKWSGTPANCEPHQCGELAWFAQDRLPEPIVPYCREALARIKEGQRFSTYGW